jgi:hypothetical protein
MRAVTRKETDRKSRITPPALLKDIVMQSPPDRASALAELILSVANDPTQDAALTT